MNTVRLHDECISESILYHDEPDNEFVIGDSDDKHVVAMLVDRGTERRPDTVLIIENVDFDAYSGCDPFDIIAAKEEASGRPLAARFACA